MQRGLECRDHKPDWSGILLGQARWPNVWGLCPKMKNRRIWFYGLPEINWWRVDKRFYCRIDGARTSSGATAECGR